MNNTYNSPFSSRYASKKMQELFSPQYKYQTFRKLWYSLAKAQHELGLRVTEAQVNELKEHLEDIDFNVVADKEKEIKHDVMAHIYAYGLVAPNAKSIIHLGATSCYVTDNTDLIIYKEALIYTKNLLLGVMSYLCDFIEKTKSIPTLGYTHYQPAQLVTVGKRASLWLQDFLTDLEEINFCLTQIKFLGCRGTTGTEASFMELFNNDETKINYKEIILEELHEEAQLIICSNKMIIPMTLEENHWYGDKTQDIEFSAMGKWIIDFSKITSDNVVINENNKEITIYMSKPIKEVQLLEEETAFGEVKKGMFVFGDIVHTPEEYESIKHNIKCQALTKMIDMDEQAEKAASNSIKRIITTVVKQNYDIKIVFIK